MTDYREMTIFKGSCPGCGVFQTHKEERCCMSGCLTLHYNNEVKCECGEILVGKSGSGYLL